MTTSNTTSGIDQVLQALTQFIAQANGISFDSEELIKKVKSLLPPLINNSLNVETANIPEIRSLLTLVRDLSLRSPAVFVDEDSRTLATILFKLLLLMPEPRFLSVHTDVVDTTAALLTLLFSQNINAFKDFFRDAALLLEDLLELLKYHDTMYTNCFMETNTEDFSVPVEFKSTLIKSFQSFASNFTGLKVSSTGESFSEFFIDVSVGKGTNPKEFRFVILETCITKLLGSIIAKYPQFVGDNCHSLWKLMCSQVQIGPAHLKESSLHTLYLMISFLEAPSFVCDEVLFSLLSLVSIELLGQEDSVITATLRNPQIDSEIAKCFTALFPLLPKETVRSITHQVKDIMGFNLKFSQSPDFRIALCELFYICLQNSSLAANNIRTLLPFLGIKDIQSAVIKCFEFLIRQENEENEIVQLQKKRKLSDHVSVEASAIDREPCTVILASALSELELTFEHWDPEQCVKSFIALDTIMRINLCSPQSVVALPNALLKLDNWVKRLLIEATNGKVPPHLLFQCFEVSLSSYKELLQKLPIASLSGHVSGLNRLLSQPWTSDSNSIFKAPSKEAVSFITKCLELLTFAVSDFAERKNCLKSCILSEPRMEIRAAAIQSLPQLLSQSGIWPLSPSIEEFLRYLSQLYQSFRDNPVILQSIARSLGHLACAPTISKGKEAPFKMVCSLCDMKEALIVPTQPFSNWAHFFELSDPKLNSDVIISFLSSFPRIIRHSTIDNEVKKGLLFKYFDGLIVHQDVKVRLAFGDLLQTVCYKNGIQFFNLEDLFKKLHTLREREEDLDHWESLLIIFGKIGCVVEKEYLLMILLDLIQKLVHPAVELRVLAYDQILYIAKSKGLTTEKLLLQEDFKEAIYKFVVENLITSPALLEEICSSLLGSCEPHDFLAKALPFALPVLLLDPEKEKKRELFAELDKRLLREKQNSLVFDCIGDIFCYILIEHPDRLPSAISFFHELINTGAKELIITYLSDILNGLLLQLGDIQKKEKVLKALTIVNGIINHDGSSTLKDFLKANFLSTMDFINRTLQDISTDIKTKEKLLRGLNDLLLIIESHVTAMCPKIMATLELASKTTALQSQACDVWNTFVRQLDVNTLGPILSKLFVDLLPLAKEATTQHKVAEIFRFLVIQNRKELQPFFKQTTFINLDGITTMKDVVHVLSTETEMNLKEKITQLITGIQHESLNVRLSALAKMKEVLHDKRGEILELIMGDVVDPLIGSVVRCLLIGCRESSRTAKLAYAECLGEIAAIDPGRLSITIKPDIPWEGLAEKDIDDFDMASDLIANFLVKAFRASRDTAAQDRAAFAIQELLKFCGCYEKTISDSGSRKTTDKKASALWLKFPEDVRVIITPFVGSNYDLKNQPFNPPTIPIYTQVKSFREWIGRWTSFLTYRASGTKKQIFQACRGVIRDDLDTAIHLLPVLLFNLLLNGTDQDIASIRAEILAVLEASAKSLGNSDINEIATQCVFDLRDWLSKWVETQKKAQHARSTKSTRRATKTQEELDFLRIDNFLSDIPAILMADASFKCHAFARALLHFEYYLRDEIEKRPHNRNEILQADIIRLQEIYSKLDEPDGLAGIAKIREQTTLKQRILDFENAGKWSDALSCYDQVVATDPDSIYGLLNCLRNLGHLETMLSLVKGGLASLKQPNDEALPKLNAYGVHSAWRLANWKETAEFLSRPCLEADFEVYLGRILLAMHKQNTNDLANVLTKARLDIMTSLSASTESYQRVYPFMVKLHMLRELEQSIAFATASEAESKSILAEWDARYKITQPSFKIREPLLNLRRVIFDVHNKKSEIGPTWLQIAKVARTSGQFQIASSAILHAKSFNVPYCYIEHAKLLWSQGEFHEALLELQDELKKTEPLLKMSSNKTDSVPSEEQEMQAEGDMLTAKTLLLVGRWMQHAGQAHYKEVISQFEKVIRLQPRWEKGFFFLARYYDMLYVSPQIQDQQEKVHNAKNPVRDFKDRESEALEYLSKAIYHYGQSLVWGHNYIFHSLPRILTLWFDFGASCAGSDKKSTKNMEFQKITKTMGKLIKRLPSYQWYMCYLQLISRICHPVKDVYELLQQILIKVLKDYPHQALWPLMAITKSLNHVRAQRATYVISKAKQAGAPKELLDDGETFCTHLLDLCNYNVQKTASTLSLQTHFSNFKRFLKKKSDLIIPLQSSMFATLPADGKTNAAYNAFPATCIKLYGMKDEIEIMPSMQRPRKIGMQGDDGKDYPFLCKPKDDLRKDCRMMEFNTMINRLLKKDPSCRRRNLYIRTYGVIPLNEECGLIEWVPNTTGLRHILNHYYARNPNATNKKVKELYGRNLPPLELFKDHLIPLFSPPVFHKWFQSTFSEPSAWLEARLCYSRSMAVMSMIGYIVGLGDRHGENILVDSTNGDCVHVDFNCLFGKGLTFEKPEKVPFRLTQNMVDAMGLTGYEGVFRKVCELTLGVLRANRETLMSVLETFIHDPLVEWTKDSGKKSIRATPSGEIENEQALSIIREIDDRLQGKVHPGLPLSVEGQVHQQIEEAVSAQNLSEMYIGWAAWL